jgi:hypothetical protein
MSSVWVKTPFFLLNTQSEVKEAEQAHNRFFVWKITQERDD